MRFYMNETQGQYTIPDFETPQTEQPAASSARANTFLAGEALQQATERPHDAAEQLDERSAAILAIGISLQQVREAR